MSEKGSNLTESPGVLKSVPKPSVSELMEGLGQLPRLENMMHWAEVEVTNERMASEAEGEKHVKGDEALRVLGAQINTLEAKALPERIVGEKVEITPEMVQESLRKAVLQYEATVAEHAGEFLVLSKEGSTFLSDPKVRDAMISLGSSLKDHEIFAQALELSQVYTRPEEQRRSMLEKQFKE